MTTIIWNGEWRWEGVIEKWLNRISSGEKRHMVTAEKDAITAEKHRFYAMTIFLMLDLTLPVTCCTIWYIVIVASSKGARHQDETRCLWLITVRLTANQLLQAIIEHMTTEWNARLWPCNTETVYTFYTAYYIVVITLSPCHNNTFLVICFPSLPFQENGANSASLQTIIIHNTRDRVRLEDRMEDLGHKSAFDLLLNEAWNPEVAAIGNSTLPTVL